MNLAPLWAQEEAKKQMGQQCCAFERISDGTRTVEKGNLVQLAVKPHLVGRVRFFSIPQVQLYLHEILPAQTVSAHNKNYKSTSKISIVSSMTVNDVKFCCRTCIKKVSMQMALSQFNQCRSKSME